VARCCNPQQYAICPLHSCTQADLLQLCGEDLSVVYGAVCNDSETDFYQIVTAEDVLGGGNPLIPMSRQNKSSASIFSNSIYRRRHANLSFSEFTVCYARTIRRHDCTRSSGSRTVADAGGIQQLCQARNSLLPDDFLVLLPDTARVILYRDKYINISSASHYGWYYDKEHRLQKQIMDSKQA